MAEHIDPWTVVYAATERLRTEGIQTTITGGNIAEVRQAAADLLAAFGIEPTRSDEGEQ